MKTYSKAPSEATDRVAHLIKLFYRELLDAGVKIDLISVATDKIGKPALMHNGYAAYAVVRALGPKERTMGRGDAEIVIDEEQYLKLSTEQKDALLDHELHHIKLIPDKKTGRPKLDCRGRPRLGMKKHDYQFGWFSEIAKRHGIASMEVKQAHMMFLAERQTLFAFISEPPSLPRLKP